MIFKTKPLTPPEDSCHRRFVVISHGRSGSTLPERSLDLHPHVCSYAELLNPKAANRVSGRIRRYEDGENPADSCAREAFANARARATRFKLHVNQMRRTLRVSCEDLRSRFEGTLGRAFSFLGVEPCSLNPPPGRMNGVPHETGVLNYATLEKHSRNTPFAACFADGDCAERG